MAFAPVINVVAFDPELLSEAYVLSLTAPGESTVAGEIYRAAKWQAIAAAGTYFVEINVPQLMTGALRVNGQTVVNQPFPTIQGEVATGSFSVTEPSVVRIDVSYQQGAFSVFGGIRYRITDSSGLVVAVSDAAGMVGIRTTDPNETIPDSELGPKPLIPSDNRFTNPLWLPRPNWRDSVSESLFWLTDVMVSETAAEQRRRLRSYPRRTVEATFSRWDIEGQFLQNMLGGVGYGDVAVPLWWDETRVRGASEGQATLEGDFSNKAFNVGSVAVIRGEGFRDFVPVVVIGNNGNSLAISSPLTVEVPEGSTVTPVRVGQIQETSTGRAITGSVAEYRVRFAITEYYQEPADWGGLFYGQTNKPVIRIKPNWSEGINLGISRNIFSLDNEVGVVQFTDPTNQTRISMRCQYQFTTRAELAAFDQRIHAMQGRYRSFHIPTYKDDFTVAADIRAADGAIIVDRCGYTQFSNASKFVFRFIMVEKYDGTTFINTIISSRTTGDTEWLYLAETIGNHNKKDIKRVCYAPLGRLDADSVEKSRVTNEVVKVTLTYLLFDDRRMI